MGQTRQNAQRTSDRAANSASQGVRGCDTLCGDMHQGHPYALQCAAFYVALVPFVLLFVIMIGARSFEGLRRARKPAPQRPAIIGLTPIVSVRRFLPAAD